MPPVSIIEPPSISESSMGDASVVVDATSSGSSSSDSESSSSASDSSASLTARAASFLRSALRLALRFSLVMPPRSFPPIVPVPPLAASACSRASSARLLLRELSVA